MVGVRVRVGGWGGAAGEEWGVEAEEVGEGAGKVDEVGAGVDPGVEVGDGDEARGVDVGVGAFDDHIACGVDEDAGRVARVGLKEPDDDGDVVGDALEGHGDGPDSA